MNVYIAKNLELLFCKTDFKTTRRLNQLELQIRRYISYIGQGPVISLAGRRVSYFNQDDSKGDVQSFACLLNSDRIVSEKQYI